MLSSSFCTHHLCKPCWLIVVTPLRPIAKELILINFIFIPIEENHTSSHCIPFSRKAMIFFLPLWKHNGWQSIQPAGIHLDRHAVCSYFWLHPLAYLSPRMHVYLCITRISSCYNLMRRSWARIHSKLLFFFKLRLVGPDMGQQGGGTELLVRGGLICLN